MKKLVLSKKDMCQYCEHKRTLFYSEDVKCCAPSLTDISTRHGIYFCMFQQMIARNIHNCVWYKERKE